MASVYVGLSVSEAPFFLGRESRDQNLWALSVFSHFFYKKKLSLCVSSLCEYCFVSEMANRNLEKLASIDAQLRLLVPGKVSEDDKLIEYDALLLDRFLDILQDLHGEDLRETVSLSLLLSLSFSL